MIGLRSGRRTKFVPGSLSIRRADRKLSYIPYRYAILPYVFPHDTWIQGVQIMPGNPRLAPRANLPSPLRPSKWKMENSMAKRQLLKQMPSRLAFTAIQIIADPCLIL